MFFKAKNPVTAYYNEIKSPKDVGAGGRYSANTPSPSPDRGGGNGGNRRLDVYREYPTKKDKLSAYPTPDTDYQCVSKKLSAHYPLIILHL